MSFLCDLIDHDGSIVGFTNGISPTNKKNLPPPTLAGIWILRRCNRCGEIYTPSGCAEMIGVNKHAVRIHETMIFIDGCATGCPPAELYIRMNEDGETPDVLIGCNFCQANVDEKTLTAAIDAWHSKQGNHQ